MKIRVLVVFTLIISVFTSSVSAKESVIEIKQDNGLIETVYSINENNDLVKTSRYETESGVITTEVIGKEINVYDENNMLRIGVTVLENPDNFKGLNPNDYIHETKYKPLGDFIMKSNSNYDVWLSWEQTEMVIWELNAYPDLAKIIKNYL